MYKNLLLSFLLSLVIFMGCSDNSNNNDDPEFSGIYVLNEGNFGQANASITSFNVVTGSVSQNVFEAANGRPIGDLLHSATLIDDKLYLVVNNSHKIEVVEPESFTGIATINIADEASPRFIVKAGENKAYVTNINGNSVSVIDLENMDETRTIDVGLNPEGIGVVGNRAYVANSAFGSGNTVSVIDTESDEVINTLTVGDNPVGIYVDEAGRVWVTCVGAYNDYSDPDDDTPGELHILNGETGDLIEVITVGGHPGDFVMNYEAGKGYLSNGTVFEINTTSYEIVNEQFLDTGFYALGLYEQDGEISLWGSDARNYTQDGMAYQFDTSGAKVDSFSTGLIPGQFYFNFN